MAINTRRKRESALLDESPTIWPDGAFNGPDRHTLVGQYNGILSALYPEVSIAFDSYVHPAATIGTGIHINKTRASIRAFIEPTRSGITLEL